jgi:tetratricopeptide (TPR) repeat protein
MDDARLRAWGAMEAEPYMYQGRWDEVVRVAEEGLPVAWRILKWSPILWASGWLAIAYVKLGRLEDARGVLDRALREGRAQAVGSYRLAYGQIALAQLHLALGEPGEALAAAETALALAEANGLRLEEGAAHRVRAEVHEAMGHRQDADAAFRRSLEILGEIQSRPELAQTLLAYGRFRARDDPAEGRGLIQAALRLFEEIEATGWVAEAQAGLSAV